METNNQVIPGSRRIIKKITTAIVCGKVSLEDLIDHNRANPGQPLPMFNIIGRASDSQPGQTALGPYVKLIGQFEAINARTGEQFRSGCAILPGSGNDMVYGALKALGDSGGAVEFAFRVGVLRDEKSAVGYVYTVDQIALKGQTDPLADLSAQVALPSMKAPALENKQPETTQQPDAAPKKKAA